MSILYAISNADGQAYAGDWFLNGPYPVHIIPELNEMLATGEMRHHRDLMQEDAAKLVGAMTGSTIPTNGEGFHRHFRNVKARWTEREPITNTTYFSRQPSGRTESVLV